MKLTDDQLKPWRELQAKFDADADRTAAFSKLSSNRQVVRSEIVELIQSYLTAAITIEVLRSTWDVKTRTVWNAFGLKGLSSAMFLNMLVKHIPDQQRVAAELRNIVCAPQDEQQGRMHMAQFEAFLASQIKAGHVTRQQIQVARVPFFVSAFWHLQDIEKWPMFFVSAREVFNRQGLFNATNKVVEDYFSFRDVYLSLMAALKLSSWNLEQLCWYDYNARKASEPAPQAAPEVVKEEDDSTAEDEVAVESPHTYAQWLLASMGKALGCRIWIAANDHAVTGRAKPATRGRIVEDSKPAILRQRRFACYGGQPALAGRPLDDGESAQDGGYCGNSGVARARLVGSADRPRTGHLSRDGRALRAGLIDPTGKTGQCAPRLGGVATA